MLTIKVKWKGKCPKHPRFNPEKQGVGAIRGGCETCNQLVSVYRQVSVARNQMHTFEEFSKAGAYVKALERSANG